MVENRCTLCQTPEKFQDLEIARCQYWRVTLHESSHYPGRCLVILNRHIQDAIVNTTDEEITEFRMIARGLELAVSRTFGASHFNYADLENEVPHAHWHFIPRYDIPFTWGLFFRLDENMGRNYAPYPKDERLTGVERKNAVVAMKQEFLAAWQELFSESGHPLPEIAPILDPESQVIARLRKPARDREFSYSK